MTTAHSSSSGASAGSPSRKTAGSRPTRQSLVPKTWPGAWGLYAYSKRAVLQNWPVFLGLLLTNTVLTRCFELFLGTKTGDFLGFLTGIPIGIALLTTYIAAVRGQKPSYGDAIRNSLDPALCLRYLAGALLLLFALAGSFILLVVPFVIIFPRLILSLLFIVDRKLGPVEALQASWEATRDHAGKIWGVTGAFVAMALLMVTIIGIPFALYFLFMYSAAQALIYEFITRAPQGKNA